MQNKELEHSSDIDENVERDVFEEAQPVFDEDDAVPENPTELEELDLEDEPEEVVYGESQEDDEEALYEGDEDFYKTVEENIFNEEEEVEPDEEPVSYRKGKRGTGGFRELCSFLLYIGVAVIITFLIIHFVGQRTVVNGPSMMNTLKNGDNIILDKISYRFHDPERFDVVVFPVENEEKNYIKRIIGLPGETIQIINGFVYISDENGDFYELEESYGAEVMLDDSGTYLTTPPVKLGEDEYFVLGDNRNNSIDSRRIGPISRDIIKGRAWVRIYPFDTMGKIE